MNGIKIQKKKLGARESEKDFYPLYGGKIFEVQLLLNLQYIDLHMTHEIHSIKVIK